MEYIESSVRKGPQNHVSFSMDERPHNLHNHDEWWTELLMEPTLRCMTQDATRAWRPRLHQRVYASSQNHVLWCISQLCIKRTRYLNTHPQDKTRLLCIWEKGSEREEVREKKRQGFGRVRVKRNKVAGSMLVVCKHIHSY